MSDLNPIKKKISNEDANFLVNFVSRKLAEFFNGEVLQFDEEYIYDSQGIS